MQAIGATCRAESAWSALARNIVRTQFRIRVKHIKQAVAQHPLDRRLIETRPEVAGRLWTVPGTAVAILLDQSGSGSEYIGRGRLAGDCGIPTDAHEHTLEHLGQGRVAGLGRLVFRRGLVPRPVLALAGPAGLEGVRIAQEMNA